MEPTTPLLPAPRHSWLSPHSWRPRARGRAGAGHAPGRGAAVAAVLGTVALLAGCAGGDGASPGASVGASSGNAAGATPTPTGLEPVAGSTAPGLPDGAGPAPADAGAGAGRATEEGLLHVVTFGSSTCPAVPDDTAEAVGPAAVTVTFPEPGDGPCTADLVPTTTVVALPDGTDPTGDLVVTIGTNGQVTLPVGSTDLVWVLPAG